MSAFSSLRYLHVVIIASSIPSVGLSNDAPCLTPEKDGEELLISTVTKYNQLASPRSTLSIVFFPAVRVFVTNGMVTHSDVIAYTVDAMDASEDDPKSMNTARFLDAKNLRSPAPATVQISQNGVLATVQLDKCGAIINTSQ